MLSTWNERGRATSLANVDALGRPRRSVPSLGSVGPRDMNASKLRHRWPRWTVRSLLLLFIPLCAAFAYYGYLHRQYWLAVDAYDMMFSKGLDSSDGLRHRIYIFKNGNVTDADLKGFIPAFNGHAPSGFGRIEKIRLKGSKVSAEAVQRFRQAVPDCELEL